MLTAHMTGSGKYWGVPDLKSRLFVQRAGNGMDRQIKRAEYAQRVSAKVIGSSTQGAEH